MRISTGFEKFDRKSILISSTAIKIDIIWAVLTSRQTQPDVIGSGLHNQTQSISQQLTVRFQQQTYIFTPREFRKQNGRVRMLNLTKSCIILSAIYDVLK